MEKYLKKKKTMNECLRDKCSNDEEYKQLFNAEQLVKAGNIQLPSIIFTPKRSKEIYSLNEQQLIDLHTQITDKIKLIYKDNNSSIFKAPNPFDTELQLVEIDLNEKQQEIDRVKFVKDHPHYYPVMSTIDFDLLRHKMTVYQIKQPTILELAEEFKVSYNIMYRAINFVMNFKYVKCSRLNIRSESKLNEYQFILYMKNYVEFMIKDKEFLYIDEASFNNSKRGGMKWIEHKQENVILDKVRISGITLTICVSKYGIIHHEITEKTVDSDKFIEFITNLIGKLCQDDKTFEKYKNRKYVLVFDNARCHVSKKIIEYLKFGKFDVLTLPPYSPYYNAAEYVFNWLKKRFYSMNFGQK